MCWYLVHTKPRQEARALLNLEGQGYHCYLPTLMSEKLHHGTVAVVEEPLFPRYLFVRLGQESLAKSWSPIRSTKGVSRLVSFGLEPASVDDELIGMLRRQESVMRAEPQRRFHPGDRVRLLGGAFAGLEGIYQMDDGEHRVMLLIELMSRPLMVRVSPQNLREAG